MSRTKVDKKLRGIRKTLSGILFRLHFSKDTDYKNLEYVIEKSAKELESVLKTLHKTSCSCRDSKDDSKDALCIIREFFPEVPGKTSLEAIKVVSDCPDRGAVIQQCIFRGACSYWKVWTFCLIDGNLCCLSEDCVGSKEEAEEIFHVALS